MKIVVTAEGSDLHAPTNPRFGRCSTFVFVETDSMDFEAVPNPALAASGGAGIRAAQFVVEQEVQAVLTGNIGPNAVEVLQAAQVPVYLNDEATVLAAVEACVAGQLVAAKGANVEAHAGMGIKTQGAQSQSTGSAGTRQEEILALKGEAAHLRKQLAGILDRIEKLEKEI